MSSMDNLLDLTKNVRGARANGVLSAFREFSQIFAGVLLWGLY